MTVYNFQVEDFHTYYVGDIGILVHNAGDNYATLEQGVGGVDEVPSHIGGEDIKGGAKNIVGHEKHKQVLKTTEDANPLVDSLRETGKLPDNYITKDVAKQSGWRQGKALENSASGKQIGGDIFENTDNLLPKANSRTWYEVDVGLSGTMSGAKQPGTRLIYSSDGLMYITTDHYQTFHYIGNYK